MGKRKKRHAEGGKWTGYKNRAWLVFNIGWTTVYLLWRTFRTLPLEFGLVSAVAGISQLEIGRAHV